MWFASNQPAMPSRSAEDRALVLGHHPFVEGAENHQRLVAARSEQANHPLECLPLEGAVQRHPIEMPGLSAARVPRRVPRAVRAPLGIVFPFAGYDERDL